jgi:asparaginyl-tRNA synthetase
MKRIPVKELLKIQPNNQEVNVKGWVRTRRGNKNVTFIALNDGSTIHNIQIVANPAEFDESVLKLIGTGASLSVTGKLVPSQGSGQPVEVQATQIEVYGTADPETFPLQKKGHSLEFLREIAHLRPTHQYFWSNLPHQPCHVVCHTQVFQRPGLLLSAHAHHYRI